MAGEVNDGGSVFPSDRFGHIGMSLRDYFAGQALAGIMCIESVLDDMGETQIATIAYNQADAMLKVRNHEITSN